MSVTTRGHTITAQVELHTEECCRCGITFAMPADFKRGCLDNPGRAFYCPAGHAQHYAGKTEAQQQKERADKLARQLDAARAQVVAAEDQAAAAERSARALRAVNTRTRRRIAAGVCPCCRRSFQDLGRHMSSQHPDYAGGEG